MSPGFADAAGPANVVGIRGADVWGAPGFEVEFLAFNKGRNTTFVGKAAAAYDATVALLDAYRRAAPPKLGPDVLKELFNVKFQGKSGLISFDDAGDLIYDPATAFGIAEFAPGGKLTYRNVDGTLRRRQA